MSESQPEGQDELIFLKKYLECHSHYSHDLDFIKTNYNLEDIQKLDNLTQRA